MQNPILIENVEARLYRAPLRMPFKIALGENDHIETVIVRVTAHGGLVGFGEASPYAPVTGEDSESVLAFLRKAAQTLIGRDAADISGIHAAMDAISIGRSAAKAGVDIAIYDILAKQARLPLYRFLGGSDACVRTDMTVGLADTTVMAERAARYTREGFRTLKVKAGIDPVADVEHLRAIREAVGPDIELRIDANQGWDVKSALWALGQLKDTVIAEVEQPLPYWDLEGSRFLRERIGQQLMLDESVHTPRDAMKAAKAGAGDMVNIKLMKSGGIYPALKINAVAEAAGMACMAGCMTETRVSISAGAHMAAALPNIVLADLDGWIEIADDGCASGGFTLEGDILTLTDAPGLGVTVDFDAL
jgi:L-alanine-DL-glutamate epimerase-like enolase superfamily enzyme